MTNSDNKVKELKNLMHLQQEAINDLKAIITNKKMDEEDAHIAADGVLTTLLSELGYQEVVDFYEQIDKLYA